MIMKIHSIFPSINGEVSFLEQGSLCTFIRLQGCNLKCSYCDTKKSQNSNGGETLSIRNVLKQVKSFKSTNITITGGEPLLQQESLGDLLCVLSPKGYTISIETNGSYKIPNWHSYVDSWIADWKTPSSGMRKFMNYENFTFLNHNDYVKFVVSDKEDFEDARKTMSMFLKQKGEYGSPRFALSPCTKSKLSAKQLYQWMASTRECILTNAIMNIQLHKKLNLP